jgi:hypothetical protein
MEGFTRDGVPSSSGVVVAAKTMGEVVAGLYAETAAGRQKRLPPSWRMHERVMCRKCRKCRNRKHKTARRACNVTIFGKLEIRFRNS